MNAPEPDDDRVTVWAEYDIDLRGYVLEFGEDKPFGFSDRSGYRVPAAIARSWQSITQLWYLMQEEIMEMEEETRMSNSKLEQTAPAETADDILAPSDTPIGDSIPFGTETEPEGTWVPGFIPAPGTGASTESALSAGTDSTDEPVALHQFQVTHFMSPAGEPSSWSQYTSERLTADDAREFIHTRLMEA